ncbi:MAG: hypothetical protein QNJ57_10435 [Flavobacteriaceae bacterium]|nr:hypothetical protein [Flavobacteriaceae bacterium]
MRTKNFLLALLGTIILFVGCNEDDNVPTLDLNGSYNGTFTVEYNDGRVFSNPVVVEFNGENFSSSTGIDRFPAGGNGKFEIQGRSVKFVDENIWTADFDWNLILNGTYIYTSYGNDLVLSADKNGLGIYKYELKKD